MMMVAKARLLGAGKIIALDAFDPKLEMAKEFGADVIFNVTSMDDQALVEAIKEETDGRGADVVVETVGTPEVVRTGLEMLRRGGTYLETGNFADTSFLIDSALFRISRIEETEFTIVTPSSASADRSPTRLKKAPISLAPRSRTRSKSSSVKSSPSETIRCSSVDPIRATFHGIT